MIISLKNIKGTDRFKGYGYLLLEVRAECLNVINTTFGFKQTILRIKITEKFGFISSQILFYRIDVLCISDCITRYLYATNV